jgi:hypothetical protein
MQELHQKGYYKLRKLLKKVPFNCNFANSVVENHVKGKIFVDDAHYIRNAYILHPYGMSLLAGAAKNSEFENWLFPYILDGNRQRCQDEWMQVYPDIWNEKIVANLSLKIFDPENITNVPFQESVAMYQRVNFQFDSKKYQNFKKSLKLPEVQVLRLDNQLAGRVHGTVVPSAFWNNTTDFLKNGVGFSVVINGEPVSTAFSSFCHDTVKEIGIETMEKYRGCGFAKIACIAYIDYCLQECYTPVWSYRLDNSNSYNLAIKLGFEPTLQLPYYRLCRH